MNLVILVFFHCCHFSFDAIMIWMLLLLSLSKKGTLISKNLGRMFRGVSLSKKVKNLPNKLYSKREVYPSSDERDFYNTDSSKTHNLSLLYKEIYKSKTMLDQIN